MNREAVAKVESGAYEEYKEFNGRKYTGMRVGGSHKWYYDKGTWNEKKITPDKWELTYSVNKKRAWDAPEGSGAPVGTEYHWYILAHQNVRKLDANNYATSMTGIKFKLAHKRAGRLNWNTSPNIVAEIIEEVKNLKIEEHRYHKGTNQSFLRYISTGNELLKSHSDSKLKMSWPEEFWQQQLLEKINDCQKLFKTVCVKIGFDSEVKEAYENALNSINQTVTAVHTFAAIFNRVYRPKN